MDTDEQSMNSEVTMRGGEDSALGRIDQYKLVRELGSGGFGTVYLAKDMVSGVDVAVKGLPSFVSNNREELENIRANFALVSRLHHPNIAAALVLHPAKEVLYFSEDVRQKLRVLPGDTLMVMEYAPGIALSQWRKQFPERKVPIDKAVEIIRQVASALDYAHGEKVLHRDVKPSNVMVETKSNGDVSASVLDFGLASEIRSSMGRVSREIHDTSGTRPYMAPEQWSGVSQDAATDQYALAVLFYELVTGRVPFASMFDTGDPVIMLTVVTSRPPDIPADLPKPVRLALDKALAKKPEDRFASCGEFVAALTEEPQRGGCGKWLVLVLLSFFAAIVCGSWWMRAQWQQEAQRREQESVVARQKAEADRMAEVARLEAEKEEAARMAKADAERHEKENAERKAKESAQLEVERKLDEDAKLHAKDNPDDEAGGMPSELTPSSIEPRHGDVKTLVLPGGVEMEMIFCGPGRYVYGEEKIPSYMDHGFWLGKYEVTQKQWQSVMGENPSRWIGDNLPVESISWDNCQEFVRRVNGILDCGARLPTEHEWEYACRAGSKTTYSWGDSLNGDMANCDGNYPEGTTKMGPYLARTAPVDSYGANPWGFYCMHGNVSEWCEDLYVVSESYRVLRGGSWSYSALSCSSSSRSRHNPGILFGDYGIRLACDSDIKR